MKSRLSLRRRAAREDRDDAWVAMPQFEQNAISGTSWPQFGHSSGAPEPGSCSSRSSAACSTTRSEQREYRHHQVEAQVRALRKPGDVDQPPSGVDDQHHRGLGQKRRKPLPTVLLRCVSSAPEPQCRADHSAHGRRGQRHRQTLDARLDEE